MPTPLNKRRCCAKLVRLKASYRCRGRIEPGKSKRVGFVLCGKKGKKSFSRIPESKRCMGYNPDTKHFEFRSCRR